MKKRNKTKKIAWIKMPVTLTDRQRIAELMDQKGVAGLGAYIAIICEMYRRQSRCLTMTQLKGLKFAGATHKTIMDVVDGFGLFRKDMMGHLYSAIDYLEFEDEDEKDAEVDEKTIECELPPVPSPVRVYKDRDKDEDHHIDGADCIMQIPEHSQWTEVTLMKSGFGELIKRNWQTAIEQFRNHAIANCTIGQIHNVDDAKKYFYFYVTNPVSGNMLRKALENHECQHPQQNVYRFEDVDSVNGHRSYHGIPVPDDAPPRPDERAEWDNENGCWITPTF